MSIEINWSNFTVFLINAVVNCNQKNNMTESKQHYLIWCSPFDDDTNMTTVKFTVGFTRTKVFLVRRQTLSWTSHSLWTKSMWVTPYIMIEKWIENSRFDQYDWWWTLEREGLKWSPPPSNLFPSNKIRRVGRRGCIFRNISA